MMKKVFFALAAICALAFGVRAENMYYNVGPFYKISVRGDVDVVYRCNPDSTGMARYDNALFPEEPFKISIEKGKLEVRRSPEATGPRPVLFVWSDFLMEVTNEGLGEMLVEPGAIVPEFSATLIGNGKIVVEHLDATDASATVNTGNGTIVMSGRCKKANFNMIGAGVIQADNLDAVKVDCKVIGTGSIGCWPMESLNVHGIGTTKVYYKGDPAVKKNGGARLYPMVEVEETPAPDMSVSPVDSDEDDE